MLGAPTLLRLLQASSAFTRQLVLTFASFAAASESRSFSAYPHIPEPLESVVLAGAG